MNLQMGVEWMGKGPNGEGGAIVFGWTRLVRRAGRGKGKGKAKPNATNKGKSNYSQMSRVIYHQVITNWPLYNCARKREIFVIQMVIPSSWLMSYTNLSSYEVACVLRSTLSQKPGNLGVASNNGKERPTRRGATTITVSG